MRMSKFTCGHPQAFDYLDLSSVILLRLIPIVDILCSNAVVAGLNMPATPMAISAELKLMIKR